MALIPKQPISILKRNINADFKGLFKSIGKGVVDLSFGNWANLRKDAVETLSALGVEAKPEQFAWLWIYRSMGRATTALLDDSRATLPNILKEKDVERAFSQLDFSWEEKEFQLDSDFLQRPREISILPDFQKTLGDGLRRLGLSDAAAQSISDRFPRYFTFALVEEWHAHSKDYERVKQALDHPLREAEDRELGWRRYNAWLQKQPDEPLFAEAFGLRQVYVPLCAYWEEPPPMDEDDKSEGPTTRHVVDLETELTKWVNSANKNDAVRLISAGPGGGKSSFCKMFAAKLLEREVDVRVLLVPLHRFNLEGDLVSAIGQFVRFDDYVRGNPLDPETGERRLLVIFDGLDELFAQGQSMQETVASFLREIKSQLKNFNLREARLQVLLSGRELVVQANQSEFRKPEQILQVLPYSHFTTEEGRGRQWKKYEYSDPGRYLLKDRRDDWWRRYGRASGENYEQMPPELDKGNLREITSQPLLNYLVALSYRRGEVNFSEEQNVNAVYTDLLKSVYERGWEDDQHPALEGVTQNQFERVLEDIALATWHGNGRTATVRDIERYCTLSRNETILQKIAKDAKTGVTRLLAAFYFRETGQGEKTFEFTHKSFGEYLSMRRVVNLLKRIANKLAEYEEGSEDGWDRKTALVRWAEVCGGAPLDEYRFAFLHREVKRCSDDDDRVSLWQKTLCDLIGYVLLHGMPMERLDPRPSYAEESRQSRNAEEALLIVLNACSCVTQQLSTIDWPTLLDYPGKSNAFGTWLGRLREQRVSDEEIAPLSYLGWLNLGGCSLPFVDLVGADLSGARLRDANLSGARLRDANLSGANLSGARLRRSDLSGARLRRADLSGADLIVADLSVANLSRADLSEANLSRADLSEANLSGARLSVANLSRADLSRADLSGANGLLPDRLLQAKSWREAKLPEDLEYLKQEQ